MAYDLASIRAAFPALARTQDGARVAYLDGPAGTQVPQAVIDAIAAVHAHGVSNQGGGFGASVAADRIVADARSACADLMGASHDEIVFGQNMTSLTFSFSRAIGRAWEPGDRVVLTDLDHEANRAPWQSAADEHGATIDEAQLDPATGMLDPDSVTSLIGERTRLVAITAASNALGSVTDLAPVIAAAHEVGAVVFVDAVHFSAHRINDLHGLGADVIAASAYKFFGPHTGILAGRRELLESLTPYKVAPAPNRAPDRWETGTQSFESLAGVTAAVEHLAGLGEGEDRRGRLIDAFDRIRRHEETLAARFLAGIGEIPGVVLHGATDLARRVATFAITVEGLSPGEVADRLSRQGVYVWAGHYYATAVMERLGLDRTGGAVRIGFVHYTSPDEVDRVLDALGSMA